MPSGAQYTITVTIQGKIVTPKGATGPTTFTKQVTNTGAGTGSDPQSVGFAVDGLRQGVWTISASSNLTGQVTGCQANVPGFVTLSIAGGQGPHCN